MDLKGNVILISGSSTGIGKAVARRCLAAGARVMLHGLDQAETAATAHELDSPFFCCDFAVPGTPAQLVAATVAQFGRLDGLVNNAASTARSDLAGTSEVFFDQLVAVNLRAPLQLIRAAVPQFRAQRGGAVVNVGSVNAYCGEPELLAYSITKGGLMTLTRNLADALACENIRINQINPGWTLSENELALKIRAGMPDDWYLKVPRQFAPSGRILSTDEVASPVVLWLSPESHPISGAIYEVEQFPMIGRNPHKQM